MSADDPAVAVRCLHARTNQHDLAPLDDLFAPTYVFHDPNAPTAQTSADRQHLALQAHTAFPDFQWQSDEVHRTGDAVVDHWTFRGTHAPSGTSVLLRGTTIYHFAEGKIVDEWIAYDRSDFQRLLALRRSADEAPPTDA